jgi:perosamine synthetase
MRGKMAILGGPKTVTIPSPPYPIIGAEEIGAAIRVLMSGQLSDCGRGQFVAKMEDDFAAYFGTKYALSFSSGTASLHGALFAVGVRPGTEVLTANNTWVSGITAIFHAGGTPVFCDIKPGALHIDPADIRRKAGPHTKAVIVTHLWGIPADMDGILKVANDLKLGVVEDCSHAHGAKYKGRFVGTLGDVGCFSLQGSKAIVAGEGGILITNSRRYYQRAMIPGHHDARLSKALTLAELRPFAQTGGYWKYRIPPLAAAIATAQLKRLDELNAARQANFDQLHARLTKRVPFISWPKLPPKSRRGWYGAPATYTYDQEKVPRDLFAEACAAEGVPLGTGYQNWYQTPLFQDTKLLSQLWPVKHANGVEYTPLPPGALPNDEALRRKFLCFHIPAIEVPAYVEQTAKAIEKVAENMASLADLSARRTRTNAKA